MPTSRRTRIAIAAVAIAACTAACGTDDSGTAAPASGTSAAAGVPTSRQATEPSTMTVRVDDMAFSPAELRVGVGTTVTWEFADSAAHSVQGIGDRAMGLNSPILNKGSWSYTFTTPGNYRYLCSLHPEMRGAVVVE
ncbi:cupredoxin domain-containing protein [Nocardia asteroides]|uniref:cupredoxin domain-containing protein n=1 Tax=Nocardia asteroides TaxID=1824 RepID=UPI001E4A8440|nr:cupredoxin family copper-binding protein [Nocardia asteroides]UGT60052.1 cupredoxin family copper-binding protein [Nocardia asteroides]